MARVSMIIPALNEEESIGQVVAEMPWDLIAECIVVDNGSTDRTAAIAAAAGARVVQAPRGYGRACLAGSNAALASSDILAYMDGDGADIVAGLSKLIDPDLRGEADFVIGSRLRGHREPGSMLSSQVFAGRFVGFCCGCCRGCGIRICARFVRSGGVAGCDAHGGADLWVEPGDADQGGSAGASDSGSAVDYRCRIGGVSKVSGDWKASFKAGTRFWKCCSGWDWDGGRENRSELWAVVGAGDRETLPTITFASLR